MKNFLKIFILMILIFSSSTAKSEAKLKALVFEFIDDREGAAKFIWNEVEKAQTSGEFKTLEFAKHSGYVFSVSPQLGRENAKKALIETNSELIVWGRIEGTITVVGVSWRGRDEKGAEAFEGVYTTQFLFFFKSHNLQNRPDVLILTLKALDRYIARDYEQAREIFEKLFESAEPAFALDDLSLLRGWCWIKKYSESLDSNDFEKARRALLFPFKRLKERENPLLVGALKASLAYLYLIKSTCDSQGSEDLKSSAKALVEQAMEMLKVAGAKELEIEAANLIKNQLACPKQSEPINN